MRIPGFGVTRHWLEGIGHEWVSFPMRGPAQISPLGRGSEVRVHTRCGYGSPNARVANCSNCVARVCTRALIVEALHSCPQSSSFTAHTLHVETPCTCIATSEFAQAFSLRWEPSESSVRTALPGPAAPGPPGSAPRDQAPLVVPAAVPALSPCAVCRCCSNGFVRR